MPGRLCRLEAMSGPGRMVPTTGIALGPVSNVGRTPRSGPPGFQVQQPIQRFFSRYRDPLVKEVDVLVTLWDQ